MSSDDNNKNFSDVENTCVVCFKTAEIYSIGVCDHPVCFECSTRMRVLCRQNECPICRGDMPEVIFTNDVAPYQNLSKEMRSNLLDRKYGLKFTTSAVQRAYYRLLEHKCPICCNNSGEQHRSHFRTFHQLKDHMRREHELFYCDLCVDNLKIFSFERKCYTRQELGQHRRKGDVDNRSHRGHPLCEFCDTRYVDSDELFRHLRRDHLYCHFCDADGKHQYYNTYEDLRNHFLDEHYLCEEGECKNEKFTSVFRTDIDYKAHVASVHSRHLSKAANRQARTLELEFTLAPRMKHEYMKSGRQKIIDQDDEEGAVGFDCAYHDSSASREGNSVRSKTVISSLAAESFPSLGDNNQQTRPTTSVTFSSEEFPILGRSNTGINKSSPIVINSKLNHDYSKIGSGNSTSQVPEVTITRTVRSSHTFVRNEENFPALSHPSSASTAGTSTVRLSLNNAQDRMKPPNVSIHVNHKSNGALTTRISTTTGSQSVQVHQSPSEDFPALTSSVPVVEPSWVAHKSKKNESKINKTAAAPVLPPSNLTDFPTLSKSGVKNEKKTKKSNSVKVPLSNAWVNLNTFNNGTKTIHENKQKLKTEGKSSELNECKTKSKKKKPTVTTKTPETVKHEENGLIKKRSELKIGPIGVGEQERKPPPGFNLKPPPGLNTLNKANITQNLMNLSLGPHEGPSNDLTFTNSTGQSYSIRPITKYCQPQNFAQRNKNLVEKFMMVLNENQVLQEFKNYSDIFRSGLMPANKYYEHCKSVLDEMFDEIFPELLVLLPDIEKQRELYEVHISNGPKKNLVVCQNCKQIVMKNELKSHYNYHALDSNFPVLGPNPEVTNNAWRK